jgi:hypothetical protein
MQVGAAKSIYIRARSPRTTIVPDLIPDQHPHNTLRSYQSFLFFLAIMSLSANFVGNNNVNNKLGPMVKDMSIRLKEVDKPVVIPLGQKIAVTGESTRIFVNFNDASTKRYDVSVGYTFKEDVEVDAQCKTSNQGVLHVFTVAKY